MKAKDVTLDGYYVVEADDGRGVWRRRTRDASVTWCDLAAPHMTPFPVWHDEVERLEVIARLDLATLSVERLPR